jgi:hypothetical protein
VCAWTWRPRDYSSSYLDERVEICYIEDTNVQTANSRPRESHGGVDGTISPEATGGSIAEGSIAGVARASPVRVGLIGAGQMGTDILVQTEQMAGIEVVAAADAIPRTCSPRAALPAAAAAPPKWPTTLAARRPLHLARPPRRLQVLSARSARRQTSTW